MKEYVLYGASNPFSEVLRYKGWDSMLVAGLSAPDGPDGDPDTVVGVVANFSPITGESTLDHELWCDNDALVALASSPGAMLTMTELPCLSADQDTVVVDHADIRAFGFSKVPFGQHTSWEEIIVVVDESGWTISGDGTAVDVAVQGDLTAVPIGTFSGLSPSVISGGMLINGVDYSSGSVNSSDSLGSVIGSVDKSDYTMIRLYLTSITNGTTFLMDADRITYKTQLLRDDGVYPPEAEITDYKSVAALTMYLPASEIEFYADGVSVDVSGALMQEVYGSTNAKAVREAWKDFLHDTLYPGDLLGREVDIAGCDLELNPYHRDIITSLDTQYVVTHGPKSVPKCHYDFKLPSLWTTKMTKATQLDNLNAVQNAVSVYHDDIAGQIRFFSELMAVYYPLFSGEYRKLPEIITEQTSRAAELGDYMSFINQIPHLVVLGNRSVAQLYAFRLAEILCSQDHYGMFDVFAAAITAGGEARELLVEYVVNHIGVSIGNSVNDAGGDFDKYLTSGNTRFLGPVDHMGFAVRSIMFSKSSIIRRYFYNQGEQITIPDYDDPDHYFDKSSMHYTDEDKITLTCYLASTFLENSSVLKLPPEVCLGQCELLLALLHRSAAVPDTPEHVGELIEILTKDVESAQNTLLNGGYSEPVTTKISEVFMESIQDMDNEMSDVMVVSFATMLFGYNYVEFPAAINDVLWQDRKIQKVVGDALWELQEDSCPPVIFSSMFTDWGWGINDNDQNFFGCPYVSTPIPGVTSVMDNMINILCGEDVD